MNSQGWGGDCRRGWFAPRVVAVEPATIVLLPALTLRLRGTVVCCRAELWKQSSIPLNVTNRKKRKQENSQQLILKRFENNEKSQFVVIWHRHPTPTHQGYPPLA